MISNNTSTCQDCGGKLKYYNKPYEWLDYYDENGVLNKDLFKDNEDLFI